MAVLLDSGFLFASLNATETEHKSTIQVLDNLREPIVLPVPAVTEVLYLLARDIGNDAAANFTESLATTPLTLENPTSEDYHRAAEFLDSTQMPGLISSMRLLLQWLNVWESHECLPSTAEISN